MKISPRTETAIHYNFMIKIYRGWVPFSHPSVGVEQFLFSQDELVELNEKVYLLLAMNLVRETRNQNISRDRNCDDKPRNEVMHHFLIRVRMPSSSYVHVMNWLR